MVQRIRYIEGAPRLGSYSVDRRVRHLKKHHGVHQAFDGPASVDQLLMLACVEREAMVMAPPLTRDSAVSPCFHGCTAFLHRHFPPQSPPSLPFDPSLHSQQQPSPRECSTIPKLQLPAAAWSGVCMAAGKDCPILILFRLPQISFTLSLKCFFSDSNNCLDVGIGPLLQFPHPPRAGPLN